MALRQFYQLSGETVEELRAELNFLLRDVADRLDKIEGIRGTSSIDSNLDLNNNTIINVDGVVLSDPPSGAQKVTGIYYDGSIKYVVSDDIEP